MPVHSLYTARKMARTTETLFIHILCSQFVQPARILHLLPYLYDYDCAVLCCVTIILSSILRLCGRLFRIGDSRAHKPPPNRRGSARAMQGFGAIQKPAGSDISGMNDQIKMAREHALLGNYEAS